jgi:hypothetical protein
VTKGPRPTIVLPVSTQILYGNGCRDSLLSSIYNYVIDYLQCTKHYFGKDYYGTLLKNSPELAIQSWNGQYFLQYERLNMCIQMAGKLAKYRIESVNNIMKFFLPTNAWDTVAGFNTVSGLNNPTVLVEEEHILVYPISFLRRLNQTGYSTYAETNILYLYSELLHLFVGILRDGTYNKRIIITLDDLKKHIYAKKPELFLTINWNTLFAVYRSYPDIAEIADVGYAGMTDFELLGAEDSLYKISYSSLKYNIRTALDFFCKTPAERAEMCTYINTRYLAIK